MPRQIIFVVLFSFIKSFNNLAVLAEYPFLTLLLLLLLLQLFLLFLLLLLLLLLLLSIVAGSLSHRVLSR